MADSEFPTIGDKRGSGNGKSAAALRRWESDIDEAPTDRAKSKFGHTIKGFKGKLARGWTYLDYIGEIVEFATLQKRDGASAVLSAPKNRTARNDRLASRYCYKFVLHS